VYEQVSLIGRLTADPTMRFTANGTPVTTFTVATSKKLPKSSAPQCPEGWKDGYSGKHWELTKFWRVTCWRNLAEVTNQYLSKGRLVFVQGELNGDADNGVQNVRVWQGNDGVPRASYELTARTVKFLSSRSEDNGSGNSYGSPEPPPGFRESDLDEIPF